MADAGGKFRSALDAVTCIVLIAAAVTLIYGNVREADGTQTALRVPSDPLSIEGAPTRGSDDARGVVIVYADFQCPYCARFTREVLPAIERRYLATGQVALAFRHLPLPFHPHAMQAAVVAECAGEQRRFWEMHDLLFAQELLDDETLLSLADSVDIDREQFDACLMDGAVAGRVHSSVDEAKRLGIRGTPAFLFGTRLDDGRVGVIRALSGARPFDDFVRPLEAAFGAEPRWWRSWIPFLKSGHASG
jgi:protein-disulfide isomerase